jgi:hypothetical protein
LRGKYARCIRAHRYASTDQRDVSLCGTTRGLRPRWRVQKAARSRWRHQHPRRTTNLSSRGGSTRNQVRTSALASAHQKLRAEKVNFHPAKKPSCSVHPITPMCRLKLASMKKYICILAGAALLAACEQKTETTQPAATPASTSPPAAANTPPPAAGAAGAAESPATTTESPATTTESPAGAAESPAQSPPSS